ncbi:hypothetical protein [Aureimonas populi]|nr:hypothetical protein [Aureimonas populi]
MSKCTSLVGPHERAADHAASEVFTGYGLNPFAGEIDLYPLLPLDVVQVWTAGIAPKPQPSSAAA